MTLSIVRGNVHTHLAVFALSCKLGAYGSSYAQNHQRRALAMGPSHSEQGGEADRRSQGMPHGQRTLERWLAD